MKRILWLSCWAVLSSVGPLSAQSPIVNPNYQYFVNACFAAGCTTGQSSWTENGSSSQTAAGLTTTASFAYLSSAPVPDGSTNYEVAITPSFTSAGGRYTLFLEASTDALLDSSSIGSYYAVSIDNPSFANTGVCTATADFYKVVQGAVTQISSQPVPCGSAAAQPTYRGVVINGTIRFYVGGVQYFLWQDAQPLAGVAGFGGSAMPSGNAVAQAKIGAIDHVAPAPIDPKSVQTFALAARVDIETAGSSDDPNGNAYICLQHSSEQENRV